MDGDELMNKRRDDGRMDGLKDRSKEQQLSNEKTDK